MLDLSQIMLYLDVVVICVLFSLSFPLFLFIASRNLSPLNYTAYFFFFKQKKKLRMDLQNNVFILV